MYFNISGHRIDLPSDISLTFAKSNILLDFDSAQCERTDEFDIPATANNVAVLDLYNEMHAHPVSAYTKRAATMQVEGVERVGFAYVSGYDVKARSFHCVFVCGEMANLLAIKEAGDVSDYLSPTETLVLTQSGVNANTTASTIFAQPKYIHTDAEAYIQPSIHLGLLLEKCHTYWGIAVPDMRGANKDVRLIGSEPQGVHPYEGEIRSNNTQSAQATNTIYPVYFGAAFIVEQSVGQLIRQFGPQSEMFDVAEYKALTSLKLTFPANAPSNLRIISVGDVPSVEGLILAQEPIAGKSITIEQGETFLAVNADYYTPQGRIVNQYGYRPQAFEVAGIYKCVATIEDGGGEIGVGTKLRLKDNLPEHTMIDLLKYAAALEGKLLNYTEADGFIFDTLTPDTYYNIDGKVAEWTELTRVVDSFSQHNLVQFDSAEYVPLNRRSIVDYVQGSAMADEEAELLTIPYCQGDTKGVNILVDDENVENTMLNTFVDYTYCTRAELSAKDASLQSILNSPVCVEVKARMSMTDFAAIGAKTGIFWRNSQWIWREIRYENGFCTLFLAQKP